MDISFYKFLHHLGLMLLFLSLGGLGALALTGQTTSKVRRLFAALHGFGLVVILIAGFGWLAKLGYGFPPWAGIKLVIWLGFGALLVPLKRKPHLARPIILVAIPLMAALAMSIGVWHAFLFPNG